MPSFTITNPVVERQVNRRSAILLFRMIMYCLRTMDEAKVLSLLVIDISATWT